MSAPLDAQRPPTVAILSMGDMGSWIAGQLTSCGVEVRTTLSGRGGSSASRATLAKARLADSDADLLQGAHYAMSVVPPGAAVDVARRLADELSRLEAKPIYVDCNAVSRATADMVSRVLQQAGCPFVDAAILGSAPGGGGKPPRIFVSGEHAPDAMELARFGLDMRLLPGGVGAASSLKCGYAALGKGLTAIAIQAVMAAERAGVGAVLASELAGHQPELASVLRRIVPDAFSKSPRWVQEMAEIGADLEGVPGGSQSFDGASRTFQEMADPRAGGRGARSVIEEFLGRLADASMGSAPPGGHASPPSTTPTE